MYKFKGWIPTVSGCLSFSIFGENNYPRRAISKNIANRDKRYIISWQKRFLSDSTLPFKRISSRHILKLEGAFWCVCIASCSNNPAVTNDKLTGKLYFFHGKEMWNPVKDHIVDYQHSLLSLTDEENPVLNAGFSQLQNDLIADCSYYVDFDLFRNGVVELTTPENLNCLSENAPKFPDSADENKHVTHLVCSQLYFFLKDIAHHHQHHDPSTDTMIDIYCPNDDDDYGWRCATLRILLRKVLEFKRSSDVGFLSSSRGLLAYANSFRHLSEEELDEGVKLCPNYNQDALEQSIKASQEIKSLALQDGVRAQEIFKSLFFSLLGVVFSVVGLVKLTSSNSITNTPNALILEVAKFILENPITSLFFVGALVLVGMIIFRAIDCTKWKIVRGIYRFFQPCNSIFFKAILLLISIISLYFTYILTMSLIA